MVTVTEIDDILIDLGRAMDHARRARRIVIDLEGDPEGALRTCRSTALVAVRRIAAHFPPEMRTKPARV